jgi:hypothetical protein
MVPGWLGYATPLVLLNCSQQTSVETEYAAEALVVEIVRVWLAVDVPGLPANHSDRGLTEMMPLAEFSASVTGTGTALPSFAEIVTYPVVLVVTPVGSTEIVRSAGRVPLTNAVPPFTFSQVAEDEAVNVMAIPLPT